MKMEACGGTCRGPLRDHNEDNVYVDGTFKGRDSSDDLLVWSARKEHPFTYAVFDGVGGEKCGETASLLAAETLQKADGPGVAKRLQDTIIDIHFHMRDAAKARQLREMGTTVAVLILDGNVSYASNVGDSRIYRFRDGELTRLSHDHTQVQSLIDNGLIDENDARESNRAHVLTQYAGIATEGDSIPTPHTSRAVLRPDDIFLLCSDGFTDVVADEDIEEMLDSSKQESAEQIVTSMISAAVKRKSRDNISVVIVKCH